MSTTLSPAPSYTPARKAYVVGMFAIIAMLNSIDRNIISIILVPIQKELQVSDAAMGMLAGGAFAFFYATAGIPLARYADVGNRRTLIGVAVTVWSGATMLCGIATGYLSLLLARMGVGVAEAGFRPAAISILADLYANNKRATVVGIMMVGAGVGNMLGSAVGGAVAASHGWRAALLIVGAPGVLVGLVFLFTVREPAREAIGRAAGKDENESFGTTLLYLLRTRTFPFLCLGTALYQMAQIASVTWMPAFLMRTYHLDGATMGWWFGAALGAGGLVGNIAGGVITDWATNRGSRWYMLIPMTCSLAQIPIALLMIFGGSSAVSIFALFLMGTVGYFTFSASTIGAIQIVQPRFRALASSILMFCTVIFGMGFGPALVGSISDWLTPSLGIAALGFAMLATPLIDVIAALLFLKGSTTIVDDIARAAAGQDEALQHTENRKT
jgi:predicted MFS family arabinose efflux permease